MNTSNTAGLPHDLSQNLPLRDIHLPDPIGWWPPAPGWWLLTIALIAVIYFALRWLIRRHRRLGVRRAAIQELSDIQSSYLNHQDSKQLAQDLSGLLRRVAITITSRNTAAGLTGREWLEYLDSIIGHTCFNTRDGQILIEAPYQPSADINGDELLQLCRTWIEKACKSKSTPNTDECHA